ncbi:hypothetical protein HY383_02185 [Candidatus Daviesbacteria bacterium]|nr:hypothetical protein [Candidatus Daviesbacteria bacterium]
MNELINFLQTNFVTLTTLFTGTGVAASAYLYNTRHDRYGKQTGKKVAIKFNDPIIKILTSPHSQKNMEERVKMVKDMVFNVGLSVYREDYDQRVSRLEQQTNSLKEEAKLKKEAAVKECEDKDKKLVEEIQAIEHTLKAKEEELFQLKREEDDKNERLEQDSKNKSQKVYFFSGKIEKTIEFLNKATQRLEGDLLRYVYLVLIGLLLAGDYVISLYIFREFLKIIFKNNEWIIYVSSGMLAIIYLIYLEQLLDLFEKSSEYRKNKPKVYLMILVGLILLILYAVLISMSTDLLDFLFRLMFIPLIVGVTLTIRKVQKTGGFAFVFSPIKVVLSLVLILLFNALFLFEVILNNIRKYFQREKFESKGKLTLAEEVDNIRGEVIKKNDLRLGLKQQLEVEINMISENYRILVTKLEEKLENLNTEMAKVRKGCENGVVSALQLPVPNLKN